MIRIVRQGRVRATRERWLLHGVVRIVTHPLPHWQECPPWFVAAIAPFRAIPTGGLRETGRLTGEAGQS